MQKCQQVAFSVRNGFLAVTQIFISIKRMYNLYCSLSYKHQADVHINKLSVTLLFDRSLLLKKGSYRCTSCSKTGFYRGLKIIIQLSLVNMCNHQRHMTSNLQKQLFGKQIRQLFIKHIHHYPFFQIKFLVHADGGLCKKGCITESNNASGCSIQLSLICMELNRELN